LHTLEIELNENIHHAKIENLVEQKKQEQQENVIKINLEKINSDFFEGLKLIGPFGVGNPKPIFKIENILYTKVERFGKSREHLKLKLSGKNLKDQIIEIEAIKFFVEKELEENILEKYNSGNLFFEIEAGWMSRNPRLKIID
jgi:single-stranded-DNA-specific exonuclease